jgi:hypothetical protein
MKKFLFIIAFVLLFSSLASATCVQSDATGTWRVYVFHALYDADSGEFLFSAWQRCKLVVKSNGTIDKSQSFCMIPSDTTKYYIQTGSITVNSACRVTGIIDGLNIVDAQMHSGKKLVSGVGEGYHPIDPYLYTYFNFNAVKQ